MTQTDDSSGQYLAFTADGADYCVPIMLVREINGWMPVTRLPSMPPHLRGVINLRGSIVPIFDLRARFTGQLTEVGRTHVVIILQQAERSFGLLVDGVSEILSVPPEAIRPSPAGDTVSASGHIAGLVMIGAQITTLLNVHNLFDLSATFAAQPEFA